VLRMWDVKEVLASPPPDDVADDVVDDVAGDVATAATSLATGRGAEQPIPQLTIRACQLWRGPTPMPSNWLAFSPRWYSHPALCVHIWQ
jgi:hypothetical protein